MPAFQVARISDIAGAVEKTLVEINRGLWNAYQRGLDIQVPKEVSFQIDVVGEWQPESLQIINGATDTTEQIEGGGTRDVSQRDTRGTSAGNATKIGTGEQIHEEKNAGTVTVKNND